MKPSLLALVSIGTCCISVAHAEPVRRSARPADLSAATLTFLPGDIKLHGIDLYFNLEIAGLPSPARDVTVTLVGPGGVVKPYRVRPTRGSRPLVCHGIEENGEINLQEYSDSSPCNLRFADMHEGDYHLEVSVHGQVIGQTPPFAVVSVPSRGGKRLLQLDPAYATGLASVNGRRTHLWVPVDVRRNGRMVDLVTFDRGVVTAHASALLKTHFAMTVELAHDYPVLGRGLATFGKIEPRPDRVIVGVIDGGAIIGGWQVATDRGTLPGAEVTPAMAQTAKQLVNADWDKYQSEAEGGATQDLGGYAEAMVCAYTSNDKNADRIKQRLDLDAQLGSTLSDQTDAVNTAADQSQRRSVRDNARRTAAAAGANLSEGERVRREVMAKLRPLLATFKKGCLGRAYPPSMKPWLALVD